MKKNEIEFTAKTREEEIAEWAASLNDPENEDARRIVYALARMDDEELKALVRFAQLMNEEEQKNEIENL